MQEEALRTLVEQAASFDEPSVTCASMKEFAWLPSDDGIDDIFGF